VHEKKIYFAFIFEKERSGEGKDRKNRKTIILSSSFR